MLQLAALLANVACTRRAIEGVARAPRALLFAPLGEQFRFVKHHGKATRSTKEQRDLQWCSILYRIDPATGAATKIINLVGSNSVMGLAFGGNGGLFATDFAQNPGLYLVDITTGFETAIAALPFGYSSGLKLANPRED
jgi:hypothetical protein